jgi:hypothetical protein
MVNQKSHEGFLSRATSESAGSLLWPPTKDLYTEGHREEEPLAAITSLPLYPITSLFLSSKGGSIADHLNHNPVTP